MPQKSQKPQNSLHTSDIVRIFNNKNRYTGVGTVIKVIKVIKVGAILGIMVEKRHPQRKVQFNVKADFLEKIDFKKKGWFKIKLMENSIHLFTTGGTFNKIYDATNQILTVNKNS